MWLWFLHFRGPCQVDGAIVAQDDAFRVGQAGGDQAVDPKPVDWAEFNRANRMGANTFARSCPLAHIVVLKICQEPLLKHVLAPLLQIGSDKWDLHNVAEAMAGRDFKLRLLELSRDPGLQLFRDKVHSRLFDRLVWRAMPSSSATSAIGTLAFRLLSRVAGRRN